ncbi:MAG: hypothetical protein ABEK16_01955 [Candidatus Nanohalobium sp.]
MSPIIKILVGALMMVLGIFTGITYSTELVNVIQGGLGPLLVLVGAFIVWLESDELKVRREEKKQQSQQETEFGGQQTLQEETADTSNNQQAREAAQEIKQAVGTAEDSQDNEEILDNTVREVRDEVQERDDLDIQELLEAEKQGQNRKTLINYLERRVD